MTDEVRNISINVQATQAIRQLTKTGIALEDFGSATGKSDRELRKLDRLLSQSVGTANNAARTLGRLRTEMNLMGKEATAASNTIKTLESRIDSQRRKNAELKTAIQDLRAANKALTTDNAQLAKSFETMGSGAQSGLSKVSTGAKSAKQAMKDLETSFQANALRYALYDVANSLTQIRNISAQAAAGIINTGVEFQKNFANVIRTSQVSNPDNFKDTAAATNALRDAFLDLQSTIPVSSDELARIGTLAAQMGIAADEVANFTEVTAKFSAASGISADEAATSLARVGQLLAGDVKGDYEKLASAILKTGVNAIATEQQIVRGTTQIAAIGKVAGFSAVDIVALSSAMSSLGQSPELQRSIVTSSFTKILTAVRGSSTEAEKFGRILGMTGKEFQSAWEGDGYNTYRKLLASIAQSPDAIAILQSLGLASQRLTPNLLKLGQAYDLLGQTQRDTQQGWDDDAELQRQFQIIADTTAAKLDVLSGAWQAFLQIMGAGAVDIFGDLAGVLTDVVKKMQEFAKSPVGKFVSTIVIAFTVLAVAITAVVTAVTLAGAAFLGFDYVLAQLSAAAVSSTGGLTLLGLSVDSVALKSKAAQIGVIGLSGALKALMSPLTAVAAAAAVLTFGLLNEAELTKSERAMAGLGTDIKTLKDELSGKVDTTDFFGTTRAFEQIPDSLDAAMIGFNRSLGGFTAGPWGSIRLLDEELSKLAQKNGPEANNTLQELKKSWIESGKSSASFSAAFPDTTAALSLLSGQVGATTAELDDYYNSTEAATLLEEQQAVQASALASALGVLSGAYGDAGSSLTAYTDAFKSGAGDFFNIGDMLDAIYNADTGTGGGIAALQTTLDASLTSAKTWASGLSELTARGAGSVAVAFAQAGPASQQAITDALALGPDGLKQLETSMADAAFFASDAYAMAFAQQNGVLADVYKKALEVDPNTALDAMHAARDLIMANGGVLSEADIAALDQQFGIKINVDLLPQIDPSAVDVAAAALAAKPVSFPVKPDFVGLASGDNSSLTGLTQAWQVELDGHTLVMPIDPNTEEGTALIQQWKDNQYQLPVKLQTWADTSGADQQIEAWRLAKQQEAITLFIQAKVTGLGDGSAPGSASGSMVGNRRLIRSNYPAFASGAVLHGPGTGTSDSMLARVSTGEAITKAAAVRYYGPRYFEDLNNMRVPRFATGYNPRGTYGPASSNESGSSVNVNVTQYYPTTKDPIKTMKQEAESVLAGIWS